MSEERISVYPWWRFKRQTRLDMIKDVVDLAIQKGAEVEIIEKDSVLRIVVKSRSRTTVTNNPKKIEDIVKEVGKVT